MTKPNPGAPCPKCGQPHTRCTAHSKRHGGPCNAHPLNGQTVCRAHGGNTTRSRAAAERRQADQAAEKAIHDLWPGLTTQTPITDPVDLLARTAATLEHMADVVGTKVNKLEHLEAGKDLTALRAQVTLLDRLLDKLLKAGDSLARLGLAERQVQLEEAQAAIITTAFRVALEELSRRVELLPADRDTVTRAFLTQLGSPTA